MFQVSAPLRVVLRALALCCVASGWLAQFAVAGPKGDKPAAAQTGSGSGSIDGRLTDWHSMPLEQATVVVRNLATGESETTVTGKNGVYRLAGLGPGEYSLEAEVPELGKGRVEGIVIAAGHATRVQAALVMELPRISLPVPAENQEMDILSPAVSTRITAEELSSMPLPERNWQAIAATTPGANPTSPLGSDEDEDELLTGDLAGLSLAMHGAGAEETAASVDEMPATPAFQRGNVRQGAGIGGPGVGESAVAAMEARTGNGTADAGRSTGGVMQYSTGHGGNQLHGQVFYLNRQNLFGARNPLTQWIEPTAPATATTIAQFTPEPFTPANTSQSFGIGLGSRIRRDKLFWFAALDGLFRSDPGVATVRESENFFAQPTDDELAVLGARQGVAPPNSFEEEVASYSSSLSALDTLLGPAPRSLSQWQGFARVDWQATERNHISVEGGVFQANAPGGSLTRSSETYGSHSFGNASASELWTTGKADTFLTANLLNTAGLEFRRDLQSESAQTPSALEAPLVANAWGQLPEMIVDSKYGFILGKSARIGGSKYPDERTLFAQDTVSWARGAHLIKAGVSFDHISDATNALLNQTGTYSYADVLNFISDQASFLHYGLNGVDDPYEPQHNCDATGKVHSSGGTVFGLGYLPCYAWYSQRFGPENWHLSTNDLAGFATEQWQPLRQLTISAGMRVEAEQLPPAIPLVANPELPDTQKLPGTQWNWGPRVGIAWSPWKSTVLRAGAGMYFGRIDNSMVLTALTQTGSPNGDLNFFFRPTDAGAPPFPYVFSSAPVTVVKPGAVSFASNFKRAEVNQGVVSLEQELPGHWIVSASGLVSLGRRLPISMDTNLAPAVNSAGEEQKITYAVIDALQAGPIKSARIDVPLYTARLNPDYQQLNSIESRANSTYEAAMFKIVRGGASGLNLRAHYLYGHAADWNPNEGGVGNSVLDPEDFRKEYGTSNLDIRHSASATILYRAPWKLRDWAGYVANGWSVAAIAQFRSGLPYTMRTAGYIPGFLSSDYVEVQGVATGMNGSGGDNRVYGVGSDGRVYDIGRNTFRYPATYTADGRLGKRFELGQRRELDLFAESFNLFNHQNVTRIETTGYYIDRGTTAGGFPTFNFLTGQKTGTTEFGKPLDVNATNFFRPRELQFGVRARF
jgi:hypothetical protein